MRDPLPRFNKKSYSNPQFGGFNASKTGGYNSGSGSNGSARRKSDCCWNFNKGVPCKFGAKCKFIERCKYCDSPTHGVNACFKLQKKENTTKNSGNTGNRQAGDATNANQAAK